MIKILKEAINKFKKWLIHRLGGVTKEEVLFTKLTPPLIEIKLRNIQRIRSEKIVDYEIDSYFHKSLKENLKYNLLKELEKYDFDLKVETLGRNYVYSMELEFVKQGDKIE